MKKIFFALFFFVHLAASGQARHGQALIDSLLKELNSGKHANAADTVKLAILVDLCFDYYDIDPDKGIRYGEEGLRLAEKMNSKKYMAQAYYYLGANYCIKADYPAALDQWLKALKINEELGNKKKIAATLKNIARVFVMQQNMDHALEYYFKALAISKEAKDTVEIPYILGGIGSAYLEKKNYPKAMEYYSEALEANKQLGNKDNIADNTGNISLVLMAQKDYKHSLPFFFTALKMHQDLENKSNTVITLGNIGYCYLAIAKDTAGKITADSLVPAGRVAVLQKAIEYLGKCIALSKETGDLDQLQEHSKDLSEAEELQGNYKAALDYYKTYSIVKDSVYNTDNNIKITNLETRRAVELKDKQIEIDRLAVAKKDREHWLYIAGIGALVVIMFISFRNNRRQMATNSLLQKEKKLLAAEKQKSEDLLLNILPAEVAEELKEKGAAHAQQYDNVTVLFTDFVNFTATAEKMTAQQLVSELDTCFKAFDNITGKYGIEKIKTVGDAYLAVGGLPLASNSHAADVVAAAIEIRNYMLMRRQQVGNATFDVRIGIHSGSVVAGIVGVKKFAYDIWGDTVNTAARMEQNCAAGRINVSATTYELVKDRFNFEYRGEIDAKGKGMMKMYYIS